MKKATLPILPIVKPDSLWSGSNSFVQFKVSKVVIKSKKIWVYYFLVSNPKQKYSCYQEAFLQRFHPLTNLY